MSCSGIFAHSTLCLQSNSLSMEWKQENKSLKLKLVLNSLIQCQELLILQQAEPVTLSLPTMISISYLRWTCGLLQVRRKSLRNLMWRNFCILTNSLPIFSGSSGPVPAMQLLSRPYVGSTFPEALAASCTFFTWASTSSSGTSSLTRENSSGKRKKNPKKKYGEGFMANYK